MRSDGCCHLQLIFLLWLCIDDYWDDDNDNCRNDGGRDDDEHDHDDDDDGHNDDDDGHNDDDYDDNCVFVFLFHIHL